MNDKKTGYRRKWPQFFLPAQAVHTATFRDRNDVYLQAGLEHRAVTLLGLSENDREIQKIDENPILKNDTMDTWRDHQSWSNFVTMAREKSMVYPG